MKISTELTTDFPEMNYSMAEYHDSLILYLASSRTL